MDIDVSIDRFIKIIWNEVLFDGSRRNFHSEIQHPASKKVWQLHLSAYNLRQGCQIVDIDNLLNRSIQYLCNEVLLDGSERFFTQDLIKIL